MGTAKGSVQQSSAGYWVSVMRKGLAEVLPTSVQKSYFMHLRCRARCPQYCSREISARSVRADSSERQKSAQTGVAFDDLVLDCP
jgi:hypothetical protein